MKNFSFKPFNEMTEKDYETIGFKSGLEIHQQLLTKKKLFCRCPAGEYSTHYHAEILRHMRPTLSELGEYDGTALMEFKTKKEIIYRINRNTVCTYEMDDTPPFQINDEALDIALGIGMLYNSSIVDEIHIARKQYLDGSIPTGFQRTSIIALDGKIPYKDRDINIVQLSIEEDSCREVSDIGHQRVYKTDRLGMPLIETVTGPEMLTPNEVEEVGQICRRLVRSTGKVRTGIGAAREDVNVSVEGGTRIEIKGVPKLSAIPLLTYNEAMRQWNLLKLKEELNSRGITPETFEAETADVTKLINKSFYEPLRSSVLHGTKVHCVVLKGYKGLLHWQTQTDTYFSREISDRVRVIACLSTIPNIIHSDSKGDTLSSADWLKIKKAANASDNDTMVLVWGNEEDVITGAKEIIIRAKEATIGVPSETRQAFRDGTNGFERILPGPERMYPDTDLPPKCITKERKDEIRATLPKPIWEREALYRKLKIPEDVIIPLSYSKYADLFEKLVNELKIEPVLASVALIQYPKRLKKKGLNTKLLNNEVILQIFDLYKQGKIGKSGILIQMQNYLERNGEYSFEDFPEKPSKKEVDELIFLESDFFDTIKIKNPDNVKKLIICGVMEKLQGRIDGKLTMKRIESLRKEAVK
jgi:glutamyl-tRNA(Gln) amidotransferase subunit E